MFHVYHISLQLFYENYTRHQMASMDVLNTMYAIVCSHHNPSLMPAQDTLFRDYYHD